MCEIMKTNILKQFLAIVGIFVLGTNSYAQENNPKHKAYIKERFGIDLIQEESTTEVVNLLSRSLVTFQAAALSGTTPDTMYTAPKRPYIAHNIFDPCGAESIDKCNCPGIFPSVETGPSHTFRVRVQEPTDLLITNSIPGTGIRANRITITGLDTGGTYTSTTDCYDYYNYDGMPESQQFLESILVTRLNNGRYLISITGKKTGNAGSGYGRIETMIITSPSKPDDLELLPAFPEIPLPNGFYFNIPIDMGKYDEAFTYSHEPMVCMDYYAFYSGQGANVVYSFELTGDTPLDINLKVGNGGYIYLLNENREELSSGVEATATLPKGKYYCILEDQAQDFVDSIPIEISGTVSDGNGNGGGGGYLEGLTPIGQELTVSYTYNIRSWLKTIESSLFNQQLYYNESFDGNTPQYSGNISATQWQSAGRQKRSYAFEYDELSRLKEARYSGDANFSTGYSYDRHGNILTLERYGKTTATTNDIVDQLTMTYTGNQLTKVTDSGVNVSMAGSMDFKDHTGGQGQYTYNRNGSLDKDTHKGISFIEYNLLNLPASIEIDNPQAKGRIKYLYSATGMKLKTIHEKDPVGLNSPVSAATSYALGDTDEPKVTDYVGNEIYENGVLKRILVDGGYLDMETGAYHFYISDHLGNNRVVVKSDVQVKTLEVVQKTDFYPFGNSFADSEGEEEQPYLYNGKELDSMHGLNWYDYSARHLTLDVPRFTTVDLLAEKYYSISPYVYCANNPIKYIDPDGRKIVLYVIHEKDRPAFEQAYNEAVAFMKEKGTYDMILGKLDALEQDIRIMPGSIDGWGTYYSKAQNTIYWDPLGANLTDTGARLSPATILVHDGAHALQYNTNPEQYLKDIDGDKKTNPGYDKQFGNKEEKRVIEGVEQEAAVKHGEIEEGQVTRNSHSNGKYYRSEGSTSTKPRKDEKNK